MVNTINEARTPGELAAWLRQWAASADALDHLDDIDARQLAEAVERVCEPGNAASMRATLQKISETIWSKIDPTCNDDCCKPWRELAKIADAALAAPARNCDHRRAWRRARKESRHA